MKTFKFSIKYMRSGSYPQRSSIKTFCFSFRFNSGNEVKGVEENPFVYLVKLNFLFGVAGFLCEFL